MRIPQLRKESHTQSTYHYHTKYESLGEFMKVATAEPKHFYGERVSIEGSLSFCGGLDYKQAIKQVQNGWEEGAKKVAELSASLITESEIEVAGISLEPDFCGSILDVGEYINGNPECFLEYTEIEEQKQVVKIAVPVNARGNVSAEDLENKGIAMLALIDAIELTGVGVEIWAISYTQGDGKTDKYGLLEIKVKASEEPFDVDKLAFVFAHAAFFRRLVFAWRENQSKEYINVIVGDGYGRTTSYKSSDYDLSPNYQPESFSSPEKSLKWVIANCEKVGIKLSQGVI